MRISHDKRMMRRAVKAAKRAKKAGALPMGALITLEGKTVATGRGRAPELGHAVLEAIKKVDKAQMASADQMTCYSTVEPCVMCVAALMQLGVGRIVFGAPDARLGGRSVSEWDRLPPGFQKVVWEGPVMPNECAALLIDVHKMCGRTPDVPELDPAQEALALLMAWRDETEYVSTRMARSALKAFAESVPDDLVIEVLPFAAAVFESTGALADYRTLSRLAKRANDVGILNSVEPSVRESLPDIWIKDALVRGRLDDAIECWFEIEGHRRSRHCADRLLETCGLEDAELVVSCRMSTVDYLIGRGTRRHYKRACEALRRLRDELDRGQNGGDWSFVIEDVRHRHANRPALLNELDKDGFS